MSLPKISVIVPVYNAEKFLHRCVDSILSQSFTDFELLLIDDGSKDRSGEICDQYAAKDTRVRVFHKPNGGASSARNVGIDNAEGEWVTFCDSDDYVLKDWLDNYICHCEDSDLVVQGFETDSSLNDSKKYKSQRRFSFSYEGGIPEGVLLLREYIMIGYMWNKCYKRSIIEKQKLRLDERFVYLEDEDFTLRYLCHCQRMIAVKDVGYYYFVPCWETKYTDSHSFFELFGSLYASAWQINGCQRSPLTDYYLDMYIRELLRLYSNNGKGRFRKFQHFRKVVGKDLLSSRLFFLTKWIVYIDVTLLFSSIILYLHSRFKSQCS